MEGVQDDYDLETAWKQAVESFAVNTGTRLQTRDVPSPDQVVGLIKAEDKKEKKGNAKLIAAKDVLQKSVKCVMRLGEVASQVASMVGLRSVFYPEMKELNRVVLWSQCDFYECCTLLRTSSCRLW